jgi:DNA-binding NtrC family response regulator
MNERILLVDDDDDARMLMCELLRRRGLDVETVDSARACLMCIDASTFDVVVTDVEMPGMSGIELCGVLNERVPPLLSIVVSGLRDLTTRTAALASGAFEFLMKPIKVATLEAAIGRACVQLMERRLPAARHVT